MQDFHQVVGHKGVIQHLQNAIQLQKVSHAYIFHGEEGSGKKLLARSFAKTPQCKGGSINSCNSCTSCLQSDSENHPDIIWVTHEKASIGVDDIRIQVNGSIQIKPYHSPYKIYIIDSAEKMTEQAQNALLKTMEEPPDYVMILLLTSNINQILPTLISRSVLLNLKPVDRQEIKELLMVKYQVPDYLAGVAADFSGGNVGKAIKYASSEDFDKMKENVLHILKYIKDMEMQEIVSGIKTLSGDKSAVYDYIDLIMLWYRDILMLKVTGNPNQIIYKEEYSNIKKQADTISYEAIEEIIKAIERAKFRLKANVNFDLVLELMILIIKEKSNG